MRGNVMEYFKPGESSYPSSMQDVCPMNLV